MSKIRRKVTVENSKTISDSSSAAPSSAPAPPTSRRPSVFERLGPSTAANAAESQCRNWLKTGNCSYGNTCRYTHGAQPRGKGFSFSLSTERPTGDLRERMKNKRQDVDSENIKREADEPATATTRRDSSRVRHREKEDIKITKERTPASEEEAPEWETAREDSDIGDYDYELSLEMKRQKIQRELLKLEQENQDKRDDIVIKKDEALGKSRTTVTKASPEPMSSKDSPSRKSSGSPKHKGGTKASGSGKKEKKAAVASPVVERSSKGGKKKGPRTPSPPPPVPLDLPLGKKHKAKHKNKEKSEEKLKEKERGRDSEKHKEKKEKRRERSDSSHKAKRVVTSEERSGSSSPPPPPRKKTGSPKATKTAIQISPPHRSVTPPHHRRSSSPAGRHRSPSSRSGSSPHRQSPSPRRRRSSSPSRRSRSPPLQDPSPPPTRRSDRGSPTRRHSRGRERSRDRSRERSRGERDHTPPQERRHERRDESRSKRDKDGGRDDRHYDGELSRDDRDGRDRRDREPRENRDSHQRERDERERDRERDRKDEAADERGYRHRDERNGRVRARTEAPEKGSRSSRSSQLEGHEGWESRSGGTMDRGPDRSLDRGSDRDRYDSDRRDQRGDQGRGDSYDRRGGHQERDRRDREQRSSPRHQSRSDDCEREREERRGERDERREREREREQREREKEREAERERAREREQREREREQREREREREQREREREERERERERKEREERREREQRQREWDDRERRERREEPRDERGPRDDRKNSRKRHRGVDSSPSPRSSPKRVARDASPNDSDGYRSNEEKSERPIGRGKTKPLPPSPQCLPPSDSDKHRLLSQVVRPQDPSLRSPTRTVPFEDKAPHWKDEERGRGAAADKRDAPRGRHDDPETRGRTGERRGDHAPETGPERSRPRDQRETGKSPPLSAEDAGSHDESKKKGKSQKKALKKVRKEEDPVPKPGPGLGPGPGPGPGPGLSQDSSSSEQLSPRKVAKKKTVERKRKRGERESDASEDDAQSKRRRGPRTPPALRQDAKAPSPPQKMDNFSDWSDEEVLERTETVPERRPGGGRATRERDRGLERGVNPPPLLSQDPPLLLPSLAPQPLMSQPLLRKPPGDLPPGRSGGPGPGQGRGRDRRPRSPSSEAQGRDDPQRTRRTRGPQPQPGPRDRDRDRLGDTGAPPGAERKSRIDQLRRGEPSRSTSSDRQDSRSHSSRRSSPDSERQARSRSRAGSYDSRDRDRDRDREGFDRDRKDPRAQNLPNQPPHPHLLQQPPPQPRDWDPEPRDWSGGRGREPLLHRPNRDPPHRGEPRGERGDRAEFEPLLPREAFSPEPDKPPNHQVPEPREGVTAHSLDGEDEVKEDDVQSVTSGGEVYEPISDDELDEILNDSVKKEEQAEDERDRGPVDVIDVDWSSLMPKQGAEPRAAGAALLRFTPGAVLLRAGVSKRLAGPQLLEQVREVCRKELDHPKDAEHLFELDLGALNRGAQRRREERAELLTNLGPCKALSARRDLSLRRHLLRNDKGLVKQYPSAPVVDNELFQLSVRLFRRAVSGPGPDRSPARSRSRSAGPEPGPAPERPMLDTFEPLQQIWTNHKVKSTRLRYFYFSTFYHEYFYFELHSI